MSSQTDYDQGGTHRTFIKQYLGPSVGWQTVPYNNLMHVDAVGEQDIALGVTLVFVNVDDDGVILNLPPASNPDVSPMTIPVPFVNIPVTIVDIGGHAGDHPVTIRPADGETIMGLAEITLASPYGGWVLKPIPEEATWVTVSG